jgi:hypothetical protein
MSPAWTGQYGWLERDHQKRHQKVLGCCFEWWKSCYLQQLIQTHFQNW